MLVAFTLSFDFGALLLRPKGYYNMLGGLSRIDEVLRSSGWDALPLFVGTVIWGYGDLIQAFLFEVY